MSAPGTDTANFSVKEGIAFIELDKFPVNSLGTGMTYARNDAINKIDEMAKTGEVKGVIVYGAGRCFCAGADFVGGLGKKSDKKEIKLNRKKIGIAGLEEITVPVVAAIHGFALGGGLELALDCHYRVMAEDAKVGLPEVNIGFLPGGQGTQRLPRIMGADAALELMTAGNHVPANQALEWGVVDAIGAPGKAPVNEAISFLHSIIGEDLEPRRLSKVPPPAPSKAGFDTWRANMSKRRAGELAPQLIIDCVEAACKGPTFIDGAKFEAIKFSAPGGVMDPKVSQFQELQYMFSAERDGGKIKGISTKPQKINSVGIIGAGLMGGGIGMSCAEAGISVVLMDVNEKGLERGLALIESNYARSVKRGSRTQQSVDACRARIVGTLMYEDLAQCDMIVEAVFEDMDTKKQIFRKLDEVAKPGAFICSNTSMLDIDAIAAETSRPEYVMGTHFFSPANVMKLLENVRGAKTSDLTIATCMAWGKRIGKWPILVGNCHGFVGNRLIGQYSGMATKVLDMGVMPVEVDSAIEKFGNKMGPFRMADMVGLDLGIQANKKKGLFKPDVNVKDAIIDAGRLGQKNGKGYYDYADGRTAAPSAEVNALIAKMAAAKGVAKRTFTGAVWCIVCTLMLYSLTASLTIFSLAEEELVGRMFFPLINEGFKVLEEGFAQRPSDIDVCYVHGYGFPRYRGGPMYYADKVGLAVVRDTLKEVGIKPAALLEECVVAGKTLAAYWKEHQAVAAKHSKSML
jgi:3-hydroxyacyl-CoA dehydrogenase